MIIGLVIPPPIISISCLLILTKHHPCPALPEPHPHDATTEYDRLDSQKNTHTKPSHRDRKANNTRQSFSYIPCRRCTTSFYKGDNKIAPSPFPAFSIFHIQYALAKINANLIVVGALRATPLQLAGWKELQSEILASRQPYLHISGSQKFFLQQIGQAKMISLLKSKDAAGIKRKVLVSRDFSTKNIIAKTQETLGEYRFLPDNQQIETQLYLYNGNRTAFFALAPQIMIVIIENAEIYKLQEALFNTLWEKSDKVAA